MWVNPNKNTEPHNFNSLSKAIRAFRKKFTAEDHINITIIQRTKMGDTKVGSIRYLLKDPVLGSREP
jgi:hypothetical protein